MQIEIAAFAVAQADPAQALRHLSGPGRRGQLDHAQRAHAVPRITPGGRHRGHRIGQRQAFPHRRLDHGIDRQRLHQRIQHRAMHALGVAAPHLVPVIARQFQLGPHRQLDLRTGDQIVEPGLARRFLFEEPAQLVARGRLGQPREQRIMLPRPAGLQPLEPGDETFHVGRHRSSLFGHVRAQLLDEPAFQPQHADIAVQHALPVVRRQRRRQPFTVPVRKPPLKTVCQELRRSRGGARQKTGSHGFGPI